MARHRGPSPFDVFGQLFSEISARRTASKTCRCVAKADANRIRATSHACDIELQRTEGSAPIPAFCQAVFSKANEEKAPPKEGSHALLIPACSAKPTDPDAQPEAQSPSYP